jgi:protein-tyrosine phosphatase
MTRHIALEGVENLRDFGDYPTRCGRRVVKGRLFRSAAHGRATVEDLEAIVALNIDAIIDLRRRGERERDPTPRYPGFDGDIHAVDEEGDEGDGWLEHMRDGDHSLEAHRAYLEDYYTRAPFDPRLMAIYRIYFEALRKAEGSVLIHCAAGKDRTGILAALTHHILGVEEQHILEDFLLTNTTVRHDQRLGPFRDHIREISGRTPPDELLIAAMSVEGHLLDIAFREIERRRGSLDAYLEQDLGVGPAEQAEIRERFLV